MDIIELDDEDDWRMDLGGAFEVRAIVPADDWVVVAIWWRGELLRMWEEAAGEA